MKKQRSFDILDNISNMNLLPPYGEGKIKNQKTWNSHLETVQSWENHKISLSLNSLNGKIWKIILCSPFH